MDKSQIHLTDIHRILFGDAPVEFLAEVLFRTIVTYICLLFIVKWLGKRMSGQLTITELAIALMLGAIVAPPMETPERGVLQGIMILFLVLLCHQALSLASVRHPGVEVAVHGKISIFVKDGILQLAAIKQDRVSRAQLFAVLREMRIYNLGKVKRMYMEAGGYFSVYPMTADRPGLSLLPTADVAIHEIHQRPDERLKACISCGNTTHIPDGEEGENNNPCNICGSTHWDTAVV
jgi:uncharacterized membrane protein YcaP (DUF421 family)